uniref:Uncharacterized protein n=1 Tax=Peronospora matthiolae TaxID=2874970 RepID=A0AAV1T9E7_9STRA
MLYDRSSVTAKDRDDPPAGGRRMLKERIHVAHVHSPSPGCAKVVRSGGQWFVDVPIVSNQVVVLALS